MQSRILAAFLAAASFGAPLVANAGASPATLSGRVLDASGGLPVQNATVELDAAGNKVATTTTDANGTFTFANEPQGEYSVLIVSRGYVSTRVPTIILTSGNTTQIQTAVQSTSSASSGNMKEIGRVVVAARSSLQTTTTINKYVDPAAVQAFSYTRLGDTLSRLPGVNAATSPSLGDDLSISLRGFDSTETSTLLDGHPIGPIGAFGGGFNYKLSPFWGMSGTSVIFGSGAAGMYGVPTIAGAINFETLNPTRDRQTSFTQGVGNSGHSLSGFDATGSFGKLGYAIAGAVQGTYGTFYPAAITQTGNLGASAVYTDPNGVTPPDLTKANVAANTYDVSGTYTQRNGLAKLVYSPSERTQIEAAAFALSTWNDKSGNGDQDNNPYAYVLYNTPGLVGSSFILPNGNPTACSSSTIPVLSDTSAGYSCLTQQQYAQNFSGPAGGGPNRWNASHMQDYHGRVTQQLGKTQLVVDGYANNYTSDEHKSLTGPFFFDTYLTHGFLASDEFNLGHHDVTFGFYTQHQRHASLTSNSAGSTGNGTFYLTSNSYFVRDAWQNSLKFSTFADLWLQRSVETGTTNFDPRLSFVYRPTPNDVVRLTGGHSYSEPDPSLVAATTPQLGAPLSLNPSCTAGTLNSVGTVANSSLKPETATDVELAYGHRFSRTTTIQLDGYSSIEQNAILNGNLPLSAFPQYNSVLQQLVPAGGGGTTTLQQAFLNRITGSCQTPATASQLGWTTYANAGNAQYKGIDLDGTIGIVRYVTLGLEYGMQSASYKGIGVNILQNNAYLVNGTQFSTIPLRKGFSSLVYSSPSGFHAEMDGTYIGDGNSYKRGAFWYADAAVSKTTGPVTVAFGVSNLFNSAYQQYGLIGLGVYRPQNQFGSATSALAEGTGTELYGLPPRQAWLTATFHI